jgi:hypothetical protein
MKRRISWKLLVTAAAAMALAPPGVTTQPSQRAEAADEAEKSPPHRDGDAPSVREARARARLLHEMIHGALQVMHRDFFRSDEGLQIPSRSLEDVFVELERSHGVAVRWLAVNADAMSVDHVPRDEFEKRAVGQLASGKSEFDSVEGDSFRYAGSIRLSARCLKCHVPLRSSNKERAAAVVIIIPLKKN